MNAADHETLTLVGPQTAMGELFRRYWLPIALSADHPPAAPARRLTRLGERLVLARLEDQSLALMAEACPHRGASLGLSRVEPRGLRCVYHGWLFDPQGRCLEQPNEPPATQFCHKVTARAYPTFERGGVIWAYLGPAPAPPRPAPEWSDPHAGAFVWSSLRRCNWLQGLEGDLDSSHIGILHARWDDASAPTVPDAAMPGRWADGMRLVRGLGPPRLEVAAHRAGLVYTAIRPMADGREYHRVHPFLAPCFTMMGGLAGTAPTSTSGKCWIPIDDTSTWVLEWQHRPGLPWTPAERLAIAAARSPFPPGQEPGPDTDYGRDHALEVDRQFFGVLSNPLQDRAVVESMGPIVDRTHEHLGPADLMILRTRRLLLDAARALASHDLAPPGLATPQDHCLRPVGALLAPGSDWLEATRPDRERAYAPPAPNPAESDTPQMGASSGRAPA